MQSKNSYRHLLFVLSIMFSLHRRMLLDTFDNIFDVAAIEFQSSLFFRPIDNGHGDSIIVGGSTRASVQSL